MPFQCNIRAVKSSTYSRLARPSLQHGADGSFLTRQLVTTVPASECPAQLLAFSLSAGQPFPGALGYEVAFYLGRQSKGESQYLTVDVIAKFIVAAFVPLTVSLTHLSMVIPLSAANSLSSNR